MTRVWLWLYDLVAITADTLLGIRCCRCNHRVYSRDWPAHLQVCG